jgi:hypothetical protein
LVIPGAALRPAVLSALPRAAHDLLKWCGPREGGGGAGDICATPRHLSRGRLVTGSPDGRSTWRDWDFLPPGIPRSR